MKREAMLATQHATMRPTRERERVYGRLCLAVGSPEIADKWIALARSGSIAAGEITGGCGECIGGWVPDGVDEIQRCDTCQRFADDDAALLAALETLRAAHKGGPLLAVVNHLASLAGLE